MAKETKDKGAKSFSNIQSACAKAANLFTSIDALALLGIEYFRRIKDSLARTVQTRYLRRWVRGWVELVSRSKLREDGLPALGNNCRVSSLHFGGNWLGISLWRMHLGDKSGSQKDTPGTWEKEQGQTKIMPGQNNWITRTTIWSWQPHGYPAKTDRPTLTNADLLSHHDAHIVEELPKRDKLSIFEHAKPHPSVILTFWQSFHAHLGVTLALSNPSTPSLKSGCQSPGSTKSHTNKGRSKTARPYAVRAFWSKKPTKTVLNPTLNTRITNKRVVTHVPPPYSKKDPRPLGRTSLLLSDFLRSEGNLAHATSKSLVWSVHGRWHEMTEVT